MPKPASDHRAVPGGRRHRARGPTQRKAASPWGRPRRGRRGASAGRDERGGAVSLWVLLMVPVSAFAAVVAMAGPQRLAAESSMQEAADDLAMFAVAWRDGHGMHEGELPAFFPECRRSDDQQIALDEFDNQIEDPDLVMNDADDERQRVAGLGAQKDALEGQVERWEDGCKGLRDAMIRDLGYLGVDMGSLRGFYSDSLTMSDDDALKLPCRASPRVVVNDAVHVALAADWQDAGWAAAQVWPEGMRMGAESMGRLSRADEATTPGEPADCTTRLQVLDEQGRPVLKADAKSRELARSVDRTALSG